MQLKTAKLAVIENFKPTHFYVTKYAQEFGGLVVASALTPIEARQLVDAIPDTKPNVVLIDSNLGHEGDEGYDIARRIRIEYPSLHILSISTSPVFGDSIGAPTLTGCGIDKLELQTAIEALVPVAEGFLAN